MFLGVYTVLGETTRNPTNTMVKPLDSNRAVAVVDNFENIHKAPTAQKVFKHQDKKKKTIGTITEVSPWNISNVKSLANNNNNNNNNKKKKKKKKNKKKKNKKKNRTHRYNRIQ